MKIFILEDDETRISAFMEALEGHDLTVARSVDDAKALYLEGGDFDTLLLDHDLGNLQMVRGKEGTGLEFAEWLGESPVEGPQVVVHSWNPEGGSRMLFLLYDRGWDVFQMPFGPFLLQTLESLEVQEL